MSLNETQRYVVEELKKAGVSVLVPLVGADDIDLSIRGEEGQYIELRILEAHPSSRTFTVAHFRPKPYAFFICVAETETWILPSNIFERFATGLQSDPSRTLNLDKDDMGQSLADRLSVYCGRWILISQYKRYRSTLSDPISLQMMLSMG